MPFDLCPEAIHPPFNAEEWLGQGRKWKDIPYHVLNVFVELTKIPELFSKQFPPDDMPIVEFVQVPLPQPSLDIVTCKTAAWFSQDAPQVLDPDSKLLSRSLPPLGVLTRLSDVLGQAWLDGAKSIVDPRHNSGKDKLPLWIVKFWKTLLGTVEVQQEWKRAKLWLEREAKAEKLDGNTYTPSSVLGRYAWAGRLKIDGFDDSTSKPSSLIIGCSAMILRSTQ